MAPGTSSMMRARRRDVSVKPNRRLDRSSTRGMIYENEELRLRTINISAEVERSQDDVKKLRRENDQLRRELWGLRDEYDKLEALLKEKEQGGESEEYSDEEEGEDVEEEEEDAEEEGDEDQGGDGGGLGVEEGKPTPQDGSAAAAPAAQGGAAYRERQVDFDMLSVVQEETENDQTDSLTGGEDQSVSPVIPRKKGVCFLLEPLPEHQAPEQEAPHAEQPAQLVCDQYLLGADGKPLRGPAGKFATTADLAQDPFQYPEAYGYATGTVVGGVLIPAVDPATGLPFTGLFQPPADVYLDASSDAARVNGEAALGFDGLLLAADAAAMAPVERAASPLWTQQQDGVDVATLQPRGAPDVFVEGAYAATTQTEAPAAGNIAQLLRNINLGVAEAPGRADGEAAEDRGGPGGGVVVALRGVPADVPDSEVLAALSQLGTVVGGIRRLGGPRDGGAAGDGDPGGGEGQDPGQGLGQGDDGEERLARLLLWPQCAQRTLPQHIGVAGVLAEIRHLSDQEAALVNLGEFEARAEDMREKSLNAANDKPFRSQIQAPNSLRSLPASPAASPAPARRATHGKRLLRKQSSAQSLEEPATNGTALSASPGTRRKAAKNKGHSHGQTDPGTPGAASSSGSTAATGPGTPVGKHPGGRHAGDVSQSSSSGQESPNKSERRRRVSILSRKPRRAASPTDAILPAEHAEHTTTASERERTNSASSRDSHVSVWRAAAQSGRRRLSSLRRGSAEREAARDAARDAGKVPWCGCWGNGCL